MFGQVVYIGFVHVCLTLVAVLRFFSFLHKLISYNFAFKIFSKLLSTSNLL